MSVLRRMLTSSNSAKALPVIFLSDLGRFASLAKRVRLLLEMKILPPIDRVNRYYLMWRLLGAMKNAVLQI